MVEFMTDGINKNSKLPLSTCDSEWLKATISTYFNAYFICLTMVLFPDSPAPVEKRTKVNILNFIPWRYFTLQTQDSGQIKTLNVNILHKNARCTDI